MWRFLGLPDTPTIGNWLIKNLPPGSRIGFDPRLISHRVWKPTHKSLTGHGELASNQFLKFKKF